MGAIWLAWPYIEQHVPLWALPLLALTALALVAVVVNSLHEAYVRHQSRTLDEAVTAKFLIEAARDMRATYYQYNKPKPEILLSNSAPDNWDLYDKSERRWRQEVYTPFFIKHGGQIHTCLRLIEVLSGKETPFQLRVGLDREPIKAISYIDLAGQLLEQGGAQQLAELDDGFMFFTSFDR